MQPDIIQWFPGHMAKTKRLISECLPQVDLVMEVLDARIPRSSENPDLAKLIGNKPLLRLLNKASLADPAVTAAWCAAGKKAGRVSLAVDCITGEGLSSIPATVRTLLSEKTERYEAKGMGGRHLKAMIVGIPNVGKSSLINRLAGGKKAKVENRPGVTLTKQWVPAFEGLDLLDMPGVLWPKFDNRATGLALAMTGAIKDAILDIEDVSFHLLKLLTASYPEKVCERYKITPEELAALSMPELFLLVGRRRGFLLHGDEIDTARTARMLLDEFRRATLGRISLETPKGGSAVAGI